MVRRALTLSKFVLCGLPLAAVVLMWARSYRVKDEFLDRGPATSTTSYHRLVTSFRGVLYFQDVRTAFSDSEGRPSAYWGERYRSVYSRPLTGDENSPDGSGGRVPPWHGFSFDRNNRTTPGAWLGRPGITSVDELSLGLIRDDVLDVTVPYWSLATACLVPLAILLAKGMRRRKRLRAGLCVRCGYDLRATADQCPECGTAARRAARGSGRGTGTENDSRARPAQG